jgi:hypothetical protein
VKRGRNADAEPSKASTIVPRILLINEANRRRNIFYATDSMPIYVFILVKSYF